MPLLKTILNKIKNMEIERIENSNGTAIKFPDGTMICTLDITVTDQAINNSYGDIFAVQEIGIIQLLL